MWQPRLVDDARMKYLGIVEALEADIRAGRLAPGERLPPQRAIAEALDVDLTTVTRAFNEARRRGLVAAQAGRGTFVCDEQDNRDRAALAPVLDLSMNIPPQPEAIDFRRLVPQGLAAILSGPRGATSLQYQESAGSFSDRAVAARWLSQRHGTIATDRVIVTSGAQAALFACCAAVAGAGDVIAAGELTYPGMKSVAAERGLKIAPVAMDAQGMIPDAFAQLCAETRPKVLYVVPNIDNPTTATLPEARRQQIVAVARQFGVAIIEDDPYGPLHSRPGASFLALAPDLTWYLATLSKSVTPALRVAYAVVPDPAGAARLAAILRATTLMAPPLMAGLASRWIAEGFLDEAAAAIRAENRLRQALAAKTLAGQDFAADPEGYHLWLQLPTHWRAGDFAEHADRAGVSIVPAAAFAIAGQPGDRVRISLGVAPDREALDDGLTQLAELMKGPPTLTRVVV